MEGRPRELIGESGIALDEKSPFLLHWTNKKKRVRDLGRRLPQTKHEVKERQKERVRAMQISMKARK